MRHRITATLGAAVLGFGTVIVGGPAEAAAGTHCVAPVTGSGGTPEVTCFATFSESIAFATDGAVRLPRNATNVTQQQLDAGYARQRAKGVASRAAVVLGISYMNVNSGGMSLAHTGTTDCDTDPDVDFFINTMPAGWNNVVSSASGFGKCTGRYHEQAFRPPGDSQVLTSWSGGAMDNQTTSIEWI